MNTIGDSIRIERLRRRWTQRHLALFAGRGQMWLSLVETGRIIPRAVELERLAVALGVEVRDLFPDTSDVR